MRHAVLPGWAEHAAAQASAPVASAPDAPSGAPEVLPGDAVDGLLDSIGDSTDISVRTPGYVAGRPVYELVLDPKAPASTVGAVVVDVDASTGMPLEVRLESSDGGDPIGRIGFSSISYDTPDPSTFAFTPPPGADVVETDDPASLLPFGAGLFGLPDRMSAPALEGGRDDEDERGGRDGTPGADEVDHLGAELSGLHPTTTVVGHDWTTMLVVSDVDLPPVVASLLADGPSVDTPAGPAQLISTRLINVLLLPDGRIAVAALDPVAMVAALPA